MDKHQKTFILGFGTQKAGTTWVHKYLSSYEHANFGVAKEYHIWDALFLPEAAPRLLGVGDVLRRRGPRFWNRYPSRELALRYLMLYRDGFYEAYFSRLARGRTWLTGDITPGYAGLPSEAIRKIKGRLESKGFRVKAIFLMRDPVERCWSAIRHHYRVSDVSHRSTDHVAQLVHLSGILRSPACMARTRYDKTITNLEACFPTEDLHLGLYEIMFEPAELERLSQFVGIPVSGNLVNDRVNVSPKQGVMTQEMFDEIKQTFSEVYSYCHDRFPMTREIWQ